MQFTRDTITAYEYNEQAHKYVLMGTIPNINNFVPEEAKSYVLDTFKAMGVTLSDEIIDKIKSTEINVEHIGDMPLEDYSDNPFKTSDDE